MNFTSEFEKDAKRFLTEWNLRHPIDFWWRKKYNVSFGSREHFQTDFIDQYLEYIEDEVREELQEQLQNREISYKNQDGTVEKYHSPNVVKMTNEEVKEEFDNLDISKYK